MTAPYKLGVQARLIGLSLDTCPYPVNSTASEHWFLGYYEQDQFNVSYRD